MATWKNLEPGALITVIQQVADAAAGPLAVAAQIAETAAVLAQILANLLPGADPLGPILEALLNALVNNTVNVLPYLPEFNVRRRGWSSFVSVLRDSIADRGDPRRPSFGPADVVGAVVVVSHTESFDALLDLVKALSLLIDTSFPVPGLADSLPALRSIVSSGIVTQDKPPPTATQFQDGTQIGLPPYIVGKTIEFMAGPASGARRLVSTFNPETGFIEVSPGFPAAPRKNDTYTIADQGSSGSPDWQRVRLSDLSRPVRQGVAAARRAVRALRIPGPGPALAQAIAARAKQLQQIALQLQKINEVLQNLPTNGVSLVVLPPLPGGTDGLLARLEAAENRPPVQNTDYVAGCTLMYGSAAVGTALALVVG